jgi:type VI protein secretion system component VasK
MSENTPNPNPNLNDPKLPKFGKSERIVGYFMATFIVLLIWGVIVVAGYAGITTFWAMGGHFYTYSVWVLAILLLAGGIMFFYLFRYTLFFWKRQVFKWQNWFHQIKQEQKFKDVIEDLKRKHLAEKAKLEGGMRKLMEDNKTLNVQNRALHLALKKQCHFKYE